MPLSGCGHSCPHLRGRSSSQVPPAACWPGHLCPWECALLHSQVCPAVCGHPPGGLPFCAAWSPGPLALLGLQFMVVLSFPVGLLRPVWVQGSPSRAECPGAGPPWSVQLASSPPAVSCEGTGRAGAFPNRSLRPHWAPQSHLRKRSGPASPCQLFLLLILFTVRFSKQFFLSSSREFEDTVQFSRFLIICT